jgi:hypothetical protein
MKLVQKQIGFSIRLPSLANLCMKRITECWTFGFDHLTRTNSWIYWRELERVLKEIGVEHLIEDFKPYGIFVYPGETERLWKRDYNIKNHQYGKWYAPFCMRCGSRIKNLNDCCIFRKTPYDDITQTWCSRLREMRDSYERGRDINSCLHYPDRLPK